MYKSVLKLLNNCSIFLLCVLSSCTKDVAVTSVSLNTTSIELSVGETYTLKAIISPFNATNQHLIWYSSNANVVEVVEGCITAFSIGTADIIAKSDDGGKTASCNVVVKANGSTSDTPNDDPSDTPNDNPSDTPNDDQNQDNNGQNNADIYDENLNPEGKVPYTGDCGIYLGLSVNWAEFNLGAEEKEDVGGYYGWGDITGRYFTSDLSYYPTATPPENISGTSYDIVTKKWGDGWRMPTKEEVEELLNTCSFVPEGNGWKVYNEYIGSSNQIFIPQSKLRVGKDFNNVTAYWTATLSKENNTMAYCYFPGEESENATSMFNRSYGLPIRPVKDIEYKFDPTNLTYIIDGVEYKMIFVEGNDEIESFYIMQTELPVGSYFQVGDFIGRLDADGDDVVTKNESTSFLRSLNKNTQVSFRLPTVQEWKYAAKGGLLSNNYKYSGSSNIDEVAWHKGNSESKAHNIAQKQPNELGIYDMSGNYEEICISKASFYELFNIDADTYGGSWKDDASNCTVDSWKKGNNSGATYDMITNNKGLKLSNKNAFDGRFITVRLVYSPK